MRRPELDAVKQALEAALENLRKDEAEGDARSKSEALLAGRTPSSDSRSDAPVIVVVARGATRESGEASRAARANAATGGPVNLKSAISDNTERKVSHPGLERFKIEADSSPSVPKACFMEPGRNCVNSGACEMRGF